MNIIEKILKIFQKESKIAILMSGGGSNALSILKNQHRYPNIKIVSILTDNPRSNAKILAEENHKNFMCIEKKVGQDRDHYFKEFEQYLESMDVEALIYAGFMKIAPRLFVERFPGINVHPADLSLLDSEGKPRYRGMHCVRDAIENNEAYIASSVHVVDVEVDCGKTIAVSKHLNLRKYSGYSVQEVHEKLKSYCEHPTYPYIIEKLSQGAYTLADLPVNLNQESIEVGMKTFFSENLIHEIENNKTHPLKLMFKAQDECAKLGFDFKNVDLVMEKVTEEFNELCHAYKNKEENRKHFEDEIGDCFFSLINLCRHVEVDPNEVIKNNVLKYLKRCQYIESILEKEKKEWTDISLEEIYYLWKEAKKNETKEVEPCLP